MLIYLPVLLYLPICGRFTLAAAGLVMTFVKFRRGGAAGAIKKRK